ncbi:hypothetical protein AJ79_10240 [Helicocarpus griseus UAMH5409]|uniref:ER membrane protein complex subunit 7 beta-sandwich domain-containing protein n=1 Tax=Helicocarpus griseus UAMH5409 TaxID=1447875 RepID=A0A2B7WET5_9EURO|nr:hypothetical protein AJ79_10240 [Helicocarpus griseus UAMH5409]
MHLQSLLSLTLFSAIITTAASASASLLTLTIPSSSHLPNPHTLPASTHATLTSLPPDTTSETPSLLSAPLTRKASFVFELAASREPRSYLLDIRSRDYVFAPYRVDVDASGKVVGVWETYRGNAWENRGVERGVVREGDGDGDGKVTVEAKVVGKRGFYEERAKFSPLSLFKNPMILLAIVALGITVGMPYLMDNMDPETRAEFEKQSRSSPLTSAMAGASGRGAGGAGRGAGAGAGAPGFDLAGWMAGTSQGPMAALDSSMKASTSGREGGGAAARRR